MRTWTFVAVVAAACGGSAPPGPTVFVNGKVLGVTQSGVTIQIHGGGLTRSVATGADGVFTFPPVPLGPTYTVTATGPSLSFYPSSRTVTKFDTTIAFTSTPASAPVAIQVNGDPALGVVSSSFESANTAYRGDAFTMAPNPGIAVYHPATNRWTFSLFFNTPQAGPGYLLGGDVSLPGAPVAGSFEEAFGAVEFGMCWALFDGQVVTETISARALTLTIAAVGDAVPGRIPDGTQPAGVNDVLDYPIHGSVHVDCGPFGTTTTMATLDASF